MSFFQFLEACCKSRAESKGDLATLGPAAFPLKILLDLDLFNITDFS
jgi:hypothetical protein